MYAYAATEAQMVAQDFLSKINEAILFPLITLLMAVALLIFLYGAFEYVKGASNDSDRETGKRHLLWGTIGMLVMLSAMAILYVAAGTFGLDDEIDDIRDAGERWDSGIFGSRRDDSFAMDRSPSEDFFADDPENAVFDDEFVDDGADSDVVSDSNPFLKDGKMEEPLFSFHQLGPNASAELASLSYDDLVANRYDNNADIPQAYAAYEVSLLSACEEMGGSDVLSIPGNNNMGRFFFCVR